ncbi:class I SAM-dependent methyltransferase [Niabella sp. CC-SYL272]|uniref:class I SAM-dependent methyltransferase n=1 Tax=Niabella agricola TaxID=2891571 RepID=UPI001F2ECA10|nr:class I SAM-dependent methyltransferase [Niabella agricola]MCF3108338.1 class I SAM-dependent methyltransferase [Niabella agricola]
MTGNKEMHLMTETECKKPLQEAITGYFESDDAFNKLYPPSIRALDRYHWTPLEVAVKATQFLAAEDNARILDIGCGVGKYCLSAGYYAPRAHFFGVEQRKYLLSHANKAKEALGGNNVTFIHANFTQLNFTNFDHFYFFNSFYENLDQMERIDDSIDYSLELFNYYNRYLYHQLNQKPIGTRVATFHSLEDEMPRGYHVVESSRSNRLKFWIKAER